MKTIFEVKELLKPSLLDKLFKRLPSENAVIEINNLLARKEIKEISDKEFDEMISKYKFNVFSKFKKEFLELYKIFLRQCFSDKKITNEEFEQIVHLKNLLRVSDKDANILFDELATDIYKSSFKNVINDGEITEEERNNLIKLKENIAISDDLAEMIESEMAQKFVSNYLDKAVSDRRLSDDELKELDRISKNLNVKVSYDYQTKQQLDKYRLFWVIENGEIPIVNVDIALQKNEKCYFSTYTEFLEFRTVTQRINYGGVTGRIKIAKGVYYRVGSIKPQRVTSEQLVRIDSGKLYLTNKRLIFVGGRKNTSIRIDKILSITPYSDGVEIIKDSGKNPFFQFNADPEVFAMILTRLINE